MNLNGVLGNFSKQAALLAALTGATASAQDGPILPAPSVQVQQEPILLPPPLEQEPTVKANQPAILAPKEDARPLVAPLFTPAPNPPTAVRVRQYQKATKAQIDQAQTQIKSFADMQKLLQDTLTDLRTDIPYTHIDYLVKLVNEVKDQEKPTAQELTKFSKAVADTKKFVAEWKSAQAKGLVPQNANVFQEGDASAAPYLLTPSGKRFTPEGSLGALFIHTQGQAGVAYVPKPQSVEVPQNIGTQGTDTNSPFSKFSTRPLVR